MDWKLVCEVGFKILTATVAGAAVFVGISKAMTESDARKKRVQQPQQEPGQFGNGNQSCVFDPSQPPMQNNPQQEPVNEPVILSSMRATQDTCGKLFAFVQSLTMVTENLTRIFGGNTCPGSQPYYQDPWSYRQPVNAGCGQTWTRISPFIIEAGPVNPNSRGFYPQY
jgi:hypothetical protein